MTKTHPAMRSSTETLEPSAPPLPFDLLPVMESLYANVQRDDRPITRKKRQLTGARLNNPYDFTRTACLLCPRYYYEDKNLRKHYALRHKLDFGDAPLPEDAMALRNFELHRWGANSRCGICFKEFENLVEHKTTAHVDPNFMRYKCDACGSKFVLGTQMQRHADEGTCLMTSS